MHNCISLYALYTAVAVGSIVTDFLLMVLPLPYIWSLRTTTLGRRILTGFLFVLGSMYVEHPNPPHCLAMMGFSKASKRC